MTVTEIKERVIWLLELEGGGLRASNSDLSLLMNEPERDKIMSALISLEAEGRISWSQADEEKMNDICLIL